MFFKKKRKALKEEAREIQQALSEKQEDKKEVRKLSSETRALTEALKIERKKNHYSERMRMIMGSRRRGSTWGS